MASGIQDLESKTATINILRSCGGKYKKYNQSFVVEATLTYQNNAWRITELNHIEAF